MTSTDLSLANKPIWLLVAQREIRVASRSKLLWVSTIGILLFIVGGIVAAHLLSKTTTTYQVAVMSPAALDVVTLAGKQQAGIGKPRLVQLSGPAVANRAGHRRSAS